MSTNARHLKAHVHKKGHFCGIRRDPILWSKDQRRKKLSKKWFHGSKKDQKKLSNETQIRQHYNIIIGVERQKKADIMISYRFFLRKRLHLKTDIYTQVGPDLLQPHIFSNIVQNPTCCWLSLTWYTINWNRYLLLLSTLRCDTIPLLLSTRNGSNLNRFRLNSI